MKLILTTKEIRKAFNLNDTCEIEVIDEPSSQETTVSDKTITVTFPELTVKEIVDSVDNTVDSGKLLYGDWYHNEAFYTNEKTRPGTRTINLELLHTGKSYDEIKAMGLENSMLNFAEVVYLLKESNDFRAMLRYPNISNAWWTWTTSRASVGSLVIVGSFDDGGADVGRSSPGRRDGYLGVSLIAVNQ